MSLDYQLLKDDKTKSLNIVFKDDLLGSSDNKDIFRSAIDTVISEEYYECVINLEHVKYMDSSGLGILITLLTKFRNKGGEVVLENLSEQVKKLLIITKLNSIFEVK